MCFTSLINQVLRFRASFDGHVRSMDLSVSTVPTGNKKFIVLRESGRCLRYAAFRRESQNISHFVMPYSWLGHCRPG